MAEEQFTKQALDKFRQWHFWWLIVFSFLLIITFVYYLPTRFLQQMGAPHDEEMPFDESQPHGHDDSGNSIPAVSEDGDMMMTDEEMHAHMDEHMSGGMDMDEMMTHMTEEHMVTEDEMNSMMDEMMPASPAGGGHEEQEGGADNHGHSPTPSMSSTPSVNQGQISSGQGTVYSEENDVKNGLVVNLNINPVPYNIGVPLKMDFFVNEKPRSIPVLASNLGVNHTKKMHVVGLRSDMNGFFHIHPEPSVNNRAVFSINHTFDKPGLYKIWSDVKRDNISYVFGHPEVSVNGSGSREEKKVSFTRNVISGDYQVSLATDDTAVKNKELGLSFDIHTLTGMEVEVEQYLGADMHLVLIKDDWSQFIHTHPAGGDSHGHSYNNVLVSVALADAGHEDGTTETTGTVGGDEAISFTVIFPEAGLYKAFAQFRPEGINLPADEALLAEFWIQVEEKSPFPVSQWWGLLLVSVLLIAGLSWWVNGYLKVRPEDVKINVK